MRLNHLGQYVRGKCHLHRQLRLAVRPRNHSWRQQKARTIANHVSAKNPRRPPAQDKYRAPASENPNGRQKAYYFPDNSPRPATIDHSDRPPTMQLFQSPGILPAPTQWLVPNGMNAVCPPSTPGLYENWCRDFKLWRTSHLGASVAKLIAEIADVHSANSRMEISTYLESTESDVNGRAIGRVMAILDRLYGEPDSERAWSWFPAFDEFYSDPGANYKEFWALFARCTTRLTARCMGANDSLIPRRAIQVIRFPECQSPALLPSMGACENTTSTDSLCALSIKMCETNIGGSDSPGNYPESEVQIENDNGTDEESEMIQLAEENG